MNAFLPAHIAVRRKVMVKPSQLLFQALVPPATMNRLAPQRLQANAALSASDDILAFQRVAGNRATAALLARSNSAAPVVQPKLTVGPAGDLYEQEADRVAAEVMRQIGVPSGGVAQGGAPPQAQVQRLASGGASLLGGAVSTEFERVMRRAKSGGRPLDSHVRASMEKAFDADFSHVKVHEDLQSDRLNRSIHAQAFTNGSDLFFRKGEYRPDSVDGQRLIAHELTHVVQQGASKPSAKRETRGGRGH